jgi:hypothetical protein
VGLLIKKRLGGVRYASETLAKLLLCGDEVSTVTRLRRVARETWNAKKRADPTQLRSGTDFIATGILIFTKGFSLS